MQEWVGEPLGSTSAYMSTVMPQHFDLHGAARL